MRFFPAVFLGLSVSASGFALSPPGGETSTLCQAPAKVLPQVCEEGGAFLCINTPRGSVQEDFAVLKGRLNSEGGSAGQIAIATQQEYTKEIVTHALSTPLKGNCWGQELSAERNFCLEEGGAFAVRVPLAELGPYTIFVSASRVQGNSMQATVRLSRVITPALTPDVVAFDPDISTGAVAEGTGHVRVTLDLLQGCSSSSENCDFIGASTGGVEVTVENKMDPSGKTVSCETNSVQGGAGRFVVGVPVWPGENRLKITVCNAVTGFEKSSCPSITPAPFRLGGSLPEIRILAPTPRGYLPRTAAKNQSLLRFQLMGPAPEACDDSVQVQFNTNPFRPVCANSASLFEMPLVPEEGYNVAFIEAGGGGARQAVSVVFGVGERFSPFNPEGGVKPKEEWTLKRSASVWVPNRFFSETLLPKVNDYFSSPAFAAMLERLPSILEKKSGGSKKEPAAAQTVTQTAIQKELGFCPASAGFGNVQLRLVGPPKIGKIHWDSWTMEEGRLQTTLRAEDVSVALQIFKDADGDSKPDIDPLPLRIAFKTVTVTPVLEALEKEGEFLLKLSSPLSDCSYKREGACFKMPALFTPKQFRGNANSAGAFAVCDRSQSISKKMDKICHALNVVDRQTGGVLQEKILDTINRAWACQGAGALNANLREGFPVHPENPFGALAGAIGVEEMVLKPEGMGIFLNSRFGEEALLQRWPLALRKGQAGLLLGQGGAKAPAVFSGSHFSAGLSFPAVSQIFWGLQGKGGGDFFLTLDEAFFKERGIDFEERCRAVEGEKRDPLCNIRPRALEILGSPITTHGYLQPSDPVRISLAPSKAYPLHIGVRGGAEGGVSVEIANWGLTVSSTESRFITARLAMKLFARAGKPALSAEDPAYFILPLRLVQEKSALWLTPVEATNTTVIPGTALLAELKEKLQSAVNLYSQEGQEIKIKIPKKLTFSEDSLPGILGIREIPLGGEHLEIFWNDERDGVLVQF